MRHRPSPHPTLTCLAQALGACALALAGTTVHALPGAGVVSSGNASISGNGGNALTVNQTSSSASINWQSFSIGAGESVRFVQPNSSAVAINRVLGTNPSQIFGQLSANGQVFLINPNGILFGPNASVNVGGLVASALDMTQANAATGQFQFGGTRGGAVENQGSITARDGGYVALLGNTVSNSGSITANLGTVSLAAGAAITLNLSADGLLQVAVDQAALNALVSNGGLIHADGGSVYLSAQAKDALLATVVNNTGVVQANSVGARNGRIYLDGGDSGVVSNAGVLQASGTTAGSTGGTIVATGDKVLIADNARLDATGVAGGGSIFVGGGWQGADPEIRQANKVYIAQSAVLDASATQNGQGGTVVAWSQVANAQSTTQVYGSLFARGGAQGGDGGNIETSGHWLDVAGIHASASAPLGKAGQWLLDPEDLTVVATPSTIVPLFGPITVFASGGGATQVQNTDIQTQLDAGTSVVLQTGPLTTGNGDITISASIAKTAGGYASLTLLANGNVVLGPGSTISSSSGALDVNMNAGGNVVFNSGSSISTNGGNVVATGTNFLNYAGAGAISTAGGRWIVYADSASTSVLTGLGSGNPDITGQTINSLAPTSLPPGNWYVFANAASTSTTGSSVQAGLGALATGSCGPGASALQCVQSSMDGLYGLGDTLFVSAGTSLDFQAPAQQVSGTTQGSQAQQSASGGAASGGSAASGAAAASAAGAALGSASLGGGSGVAGATPIPGAGASPGVTRLGSSGQSQAIKATLASGLRVRANGSARPQEVFLRGASRAYLVGSTRSGAMLVSGLNTVGKRSTMQVTVAPGDGFAMGLPADVLSKLVGKAANTTILATVNGGPLPNWLTFDAGAMRLQASEVPGSGLPVTVKLQGPGGATLEVRFQ